MCFFNGLLYIVGGGNVYTVSVYKKDHFVQLAFNEQDPAIMTNGPGEPRVDQTTAHLYIPCGVCGVYVHRYKDCRLVTLKQLKCVENAVSLAIVSSDTLYVCDYHSKTICLVDVTKDSVTERLQPPPEVSGWQPEHVAILGDTVLVSYTGLKLVIYRHGVRTPGRLLPRPQGLQSVYGLTTDYRSSFLVTDTISHTVCVLDITGNLTYTIPIPGDRWPWNCTVVGRQLWVGCADGSIKILSPKL